MSKFLRSNYDTDSNRQPRRRWVQTNDVEREISGVSEQDHESTDAEVVPRRSVPPSSERKFASEFTQSGEEDALVREEILLQREGLSKKNVGRDAEIDRRREDDARDVVRRRNDDRRREEDRKPVSVHAEYITMSQTGGTPYPYKEKIVYEQGPMGPQGPAGKEGLSGGVGPQGRAGTDGEQGPQGPQGRRGVKGPPGTTGPQGQEGNQGSRGFQGFQGPQGYQGASGANGKDAVCVCPKDFLQRNSIQKTRFITKGGRRTIYAEDSNIVIDSSSNVTLVLPISSIMVDGKDNEDYYVDSRKIVVCSVNGIHTITTPNAETRINSFLTSIVLGNKASSASNVLTFISDGLGNWICH